MCTGLAAGGQSQDGQEEREIHELPGDDFLTIR